MLEVRRIFASVNDAAEVATLLDSAGVEYNDIACVNWKEEYPYAPQAKFRLAHIGESLLVDYCVTEESVAAVATHDNGRVWEDSCCELFIEPEAGGPYYNIECNCAGMLLIACGAEREGREPASPAILSGVKRWSSLGREPFEERIGRVTWHISLIVPATTLFKHHIAFFSGLKVRGNAYKCGDLLQRPHFLSWKPISIPAPDFHRPDFFAPIAMQ